MAAEEEPLLRTDPHSYGFVFTLVFIFISLLKAGIETSRRGSRVNPIKTGIQADEEDSARHPLPPLPDRNVWAYPVAGISIPSLVFCVIALTILAAAFIDWKVRAPAAAVLSHAIACV